MEPEEKIERQRKANRKSKAKHREKRNAETRLWYKENPEYHKQYRRENRDRINAYNRQRYQEHKLDIAQVEKSREYGRSHYRQNRNNPEWIQKKRDAQRRHREKMKNDPEWVERKRKQRLASYHRRNKDPENRKRLSVRASERHAERKKADPNYALRCNLRSRLKALVRANKTNAKDMLKLIGCSLHELKAHLESQFEKGMSWENYGSNWHIDHIIPCAKFDLTDIRQQRICFNYLNLRPCWKQENLRKGDRITEPAQMPLGL